MANPNLREGSYASALDAIRSDRNIFDISPDDACRFLTKVVEYLLLPAEQRNGLAKDKQPPQSTPPTLEPPKEPEEPRQDRVTTVVEPTQHASNAEECSKTSGVHSPEVIEFLARKFNCATVPGFSMGDYLHRIHKYIKFPTAVYLTTSLCITQLVKTEPLFTLTRYNCHKLLAGGLFAVGKLVSDTKRPCEAYSKIVGLSEAQMRCMEVNFCFIVDFNLHVKAEQLQKHWDTMHESIVDEEHNEDGKLSPK